MIYYIAGPMTSLPNFNREAFNHMGRDLAARGNTVLNPAVLPDGLMHSQYMDICLAMVRSCDRMIMLEGWENSEGAKIEHALAAKSENITIEYQL